MSFFVALVAIVAESVFEASIYAGLELATRPQEPSERDRLREEQDRLSRLRKGITDSNF